MRVKERTWLGFSRPEVYVIFLCSPDQFQHSAVLGLQEGSLLQGWRPAVSDAKCHGQDPRLTLLSSLDLQHSVRLPCCLLKY